MSKSPAKRTERLEGIAIGAGFLLQRLYDMTKHNLSDGLDEQVRQCLRDCNQISATVRQREQRKEQP